MLVHTFKNKRPIQSKNRYFKSIPTTISFDTNESMSNSVNMNLKDRIINAAHVDNKYEAFHKRRRSERVLQVINSAMNNGSVVELTNESSRNIYSTLGNSIASNLGNNLATGTSDLLCSNDQMLYLKHSNEISEELKSIRSNAPKVNQKLRYAKLEERLAFKTSQLQVQLKLTTEQVIEKDKLIAALQQENQGLRKNLDIVCDYVENNCHGDQNFKNKHGYLNISKKEAIKKFENATNIYRMKIFKDNIEKLETQVSNEGYKSAMLDTLTTVLSDVKIENCQLKTDKEEMRLKVEALQNYFLEVKQRYHELYDKVDSKMSQSNVRIENAFDKIHNLKRSKSRKLSFRNIK